MARPLVKSKKRAVLAIGVLYILLLLLCLKVGYVQIVKGDEYAKKAAVQNTREVPVAAKRGTIYDREGRELASSAACYSVWARPPQVAAGKTKVKQDAAVERTAQTLSEILKKDKKEITELITADQMLIKVDKYLDQETIQQIQEKKLPGIETAEDVKRFYPLGAFAAQTLGSVTDDNKGLSGLEMQYNRFLSGNSGKWIKNTDREGNGLSYGSETFYEPEDGMGLMVTIDETIQHYVEKRIKTIQKKTKADRVMCIMMDPRNGDVLALAQTPEFDPNNAKVPMDKDEQKKLLSMSDSEKSTYWNKMWRNFLISDAYEPGSTFKLLTTAMALEERKTNINEHFVCTGSINVAGQRLRCWSYEHPHGDQTLEKAVGNSCNPVFVRLVQRMGSEKFYNYLQTFGITEKTGIDFPGEGSALIQKQPGPVDLATMGYGQGVAVTPIQLITAISSLGNEGKLMQPRLVKGLTDKNGKIIETIKPTQVRQTVSKETAAEMRDIMEYVVEKGGAGAAKVEGYRIGGKTGTAQKANKGGYGNETFSSFIGMAPMDDPQVTVLVIADNPKGEKSGSLTAAPGAKLILQDTLRYLKLEPEQTNR